MDTVHLSSILSDVAELKGDIWANVTEMMVTELEVGERQSWSLLQAEGTF